MKIFISYRHTQPDRRFFQRLQTHLASLDDEVTVWADTAIEPGATWRREIDEAINTSDVGIVLVSPDWIASPFIRDVELPVLVDAQRAGRLRLVPIFVAPSGALPPEVTEPQGGNSPDRPLVGMSRARQEATFADLVSWLAARSAPAVKDDTRVGTAAVRAPRGGTAPATARARLERIPAAGLLFDREEIRHSITHFLLSATRRLCVVHGFPGVGKTSLASTLVQLHADRFERVLWMTCERADHPGVALLERVAGLLESRGETWVRGLLRLLPGLDDDGVTGLIARLADALVAAPYLLVLDDFHMVLGPGNQLCDEVVRQLLSDIVRRPGGTKVLVLSDRRPAWEGFDRFPTGATLERELAGLPDNAVSRLLTECGVPDVASTGVAGAIGAYLSGNPALIKVYCSYVLRRRGDPVLSLGTVAAGGAVAEFLGEVLADLPGPDRTTLERLAVLRMPLGWDDLGRFALGVDDVVPLLDNCLVVLDASTHALTLAPVIRDVVLGTTGTEELRAAHAWAAAGYGHLVLGQPRSYVEVQPLLELGHHSTASGEAWRGADKVLSAAELLIGWGYTGIAMDEVERIAGQLDDPSLLSRSHLQWGRALDQRGRLDEALVHYESAVSFAEAASDHQTLADALYRRGRVRNARSEFDGAQVDLARCIATCHAHRLTRPEARAQLALAWADKERGASDDDVVRAFEAALRLAEAQDDHATVSDAHRQLGFHAWVRFRDRPTVERHYDEALRLALDHSLAKEVGAIHKELTYLATEWGDAAAAEDHFRLSMEAAGLLHDAYLLPGASTNRALALLQAGDAPAARSLLQASSERFAEQRNPGGEAFVLHELARLESAEGADALASEYLGRALALARAHGLTRQQRSIEATVHALQELRGD